MIRRPATLAATGLLATAALSGCGAGQQAQVYQPRTAAAGTSAQVGDLAVRNVFVQAPTSDRLLPRGGDAQVEVYVANESSEPDMLTTAASADATSATLLQGARPVQSMPVPALGVGGPGYTIVLHGLTRNLRPVDYVQLTLSFAVNGHTDLLVPVQSPVDVTSESTDSPARAEPPAPPASAAPGSGGDSQSSSAPGPASAP